MEHLGSVQVVARFHGEGSAIAPAANQFDAASKRIVNTDPALFGRIFGIDMPTTTQSGPTELNLTEVHVDRRNADLVLTGDGRVIHFEFQHRADPAMADRMLIYYSLLRVEPACVGKRIQQHVIVLGRGTSPSLIDEPGLFFEFRTHYARDLTPKTVLGDPLTAPWAMLATADDSEERTARLRDVLRTVASADSEAIARDLILTALTFAALEMKREDIERALREAHMPADMIRDTEFAQELIDEGRAEGRQLNKQGIVRVLQRRGIAKDHLEAVAAALIEQDAVAAPERAAFDDLDELVGLVTGR